MKMWAKQKQTGFTIVELLIVVVVIAVLAAISIVAYSGIQNRANDSAVHADMRAIAKKLEMAKTDLGHYPRSAAEFPEGFKFSRSAYDLTSNNIYYCLDISNDRYALGARSRSGRGYIVNTGSISTHGAVYSGQTCGAIGVSWPGDGVTTYTIFAYTGPPYTPTWESSWSWAN